VRSDLHVFHEYNGTRTPVAPEEREEFWRRAVSLMRESEHSDFVGYEYRNARGDRCLVVYESC
jgi:hypothetical protein